MSILDGMVRVGAAKGKDGLSNHVYEVVIDEIRLRCKGVGLILTVRDGIFLGSQ